MIFKAIIKLTSNNAKTTFFIEIVSAGQTSPWIYEFYVRQSKQGDIDQRST